MSGLSVLVHAVKEGSRLRCMEAYGWGILDLAVHADVDCFLMLVDCFVVVLTRVAEINLIDNYQKLV